MSTVNFYFKKHINDSKKSLKTLDTIKTNELISKINNCSNKIIFTGVGKNGHVASKAASTFASIGIKSYYLDPVNSLHGDMGLIEKNDIVIAISKSGNTKELLSFLECLKRKECYTVLIHSNENNNGIKYSDLDINLMVPSEADHLNIVPTSSIVIFTIYLQSIACVLSKNKKLTLKEFIFNHPSGSIGETKI